MRAVELCPATVPVTIDSTLDMMGFGAGSESLRSTTSHGLRLRSDPRR